MKKGKYIVFEGIDHCGKSTQERLFAEYVRKNNIDCVEIEEPGGTSVGRGIRTLLLDERNWAMYPETELLLFEASRNQLFEEIIIPRLNEGKCVISDRSYLSTEAYQHYGRGMNMKAIKYLNKISTKNVRPNLAFIFDLPVEIALASKMEKDRIESLHLNYHNRVRNGYLEIARQNNGFCVLIERGNKGIEEIHEEVKYHARKKLKL